MPTQTEPSLVRLNLDAIASRDPVTAQAIASAPVSPVAPTTEAHERAARVLEGLPPHAWAGMGPPVVLLGLGDGTRLRLLLDRLGRGRRRPVIVAAPTALELRRSCEAFDLRELIVDERVRFALGEDLGAAARAAFDDDPAFWFHDAAIIVGDPGVEHEAGTAGTSWARMIASASADLQRSMTRLTTLEQEFRVHRRQRLPLDRLEDEEVIVFALSNANTSALQFIARDMLDAAARRGHPVRYLLEDHQSDPFRAHRRALAILEAQPDLLLSFTRSGWHTYGQLGVGIPTVVYYSSDPHRYDLDGANFAPTDVVFVADSTWAHPFRARGIEAHELPLATALHADPPDDDRCAPWGCDVAIVCNLTGPEDLPGVGAEMLETIGQLGERLAAGEMTADALVAGSSLAAAEGTERLLARAVEVAATRVRRRAVAIAIAEAGFDLRIFGNEAWREALRGTAAKASYERSLDYRTEVPCVYRAARVTVNVGSFNAPSALNMRAYDVPAVGGCLLTDARPGLDRSFDVGREIMAYDDPAEIPGLIRGVLDDPARRDEIAHAGSERVRRDHSFDGRWSTIIDACRAHAQSTAPA